MLIRDSIVAHEFHKSPKKPPLSGSSLSVLDTRPPTRADDIQRAWNTDSIFPPPPTDGHLAYWAPPLLPVAFRRALTLDQHSFYHHRVCKSTYSVFILLCPLFHIFILHTHIATQNWSRQLYSFARFSAKTFAFIHHRDMSSKRLQWTWCIKFTCQVICAPVMIYVYIGMIYVYIGMTLTGIKESFPSWQYARPLHLNHLFYCRYPEQKKIVSYTVVL